MAGHTSNSVSIIDTTTNKLINTLTGFQDPTGVGYNSATGNIYVGNQGSNYGSILSGSTNNVIATVTVGQGPVSPAFDPNNGNVYVSYSITWVPVIMAEMTIMTMTILRICLMLVVESLESV